jgi:magnesium chelatase family protein
MQQGECSEAIRARVVAARELQWSRLGPGCTNAKMAPKELRETVPLDEESDAFMRVVLARMNLSARVFDRILKVGRTVADLQGADRVSKAHLAEAVQYRERVDA